MKSRIPFLLICFLTVFRSQAQTTLLADPILPGKPLMVKNEVKYSGTPYQFTESVYAKITLNNGRTYENVKMRYDVLNDVVEFEREGQTYLLDPSTAKEFSFTKQLANENFLFRNGFTVPHYQNTNYFEIISDGKIQVLKKHTKHIVNDPAATYGSSLSQVIQDEAELFAVLPDGSARLFKATKKSVLGLCLTSPGKNTSTLLTSCTIPYGQRKRMLRFLVHAQTRIGTVIILI
jgi:hypothetical protein